MFLRHRMRVPNSPRPWRHFSLWVFFMMVLLGGVKWCLTVVLVCISLVKNDTEHLSICLLANSSLFLKIIFTWSNTSGKLYAKMLVVLCPGNGISYFLLCFCVSQGFTKGSKNQYEGWMDGWWVDRYIDVLQVLQGIGLYNSGGWQSKSKIHTIEWVVRKDGLELKLHPQNSFSLRETSVLL